MAKSNNNNNNNNNNNTEEEKKEEEEIKGKGMSSSTSTTLFKDVFASHKRCGRNGTDDPNRIDDLLSGSIIDMTRIHNHHIQNQNQTQNQARSQNQTKNDDADEVNVNRSRSRSRSKSVRIKKDNVNESDRDYLTRSSMRLLHKYEDNTILYLVDNKSSKNSSSSCSSSDNDNKDHHNNHTHDHDLICYGFHEYPGVYLYPQALSEDLQYQLAYEAVTQYCELQSEITASTTTPSTSTSTSTSIPCYRTNIDLLPPKSNERLNIKNNINKNDTENEESDDPSNNDDDESMWNLWKQEQRIQNRRSPQGKKGQQQGENGNGKKKKGQQHQQYYRRFTKLSWSTMGYHYDWTKRCYNPQQQVIVMPTTITKVSKLFANLASLASTGTTTTSTSTTPSSSSFIPSASIVNYYTVKSTMGCHRDDLEHPQAMDKPIVSLSVGLSGVYILGGPTLNGFNEDTNNNDKDNLYHHPVRAFLLRPGDVLLVGGRSRLNYHAMSRIIPSPAMLHYEKTIVQHQNDQNDPSQHNGQNHGIDNVAYTIDNADDNDANDADIDVAIASPSSSSSSSSSLSSSSFVIGRNAITLEHILQIKEEEEYAPPSPPPSLLSPTTKNNTNNTTNNNTNYNKKSSDENQNNNTSNITSIGNTKEQEYVTEYLQHHRININIRQVYPN